jgi:predicted transcriptional regulator
MDSDDAVELVKRAELLSFLRKGSADSETLERNLSSSRSTIHRATQSLVAEGFVEKVDGEFRLTETGRVVAARTEQFRTELDAVDRLDPILDAIDTENVDLPLEHLADATVECPRPGQPHVVVKRVDDLLDEADSLQMFSRVVSPIYVDITHRAIQDGAEIDVIFRRDVVEALFSEYGTKARDAAKTGRFDVRIHDDCPFELFLFDDVVGISAHDDRGLPRGFVETSNPTVVDWAESVFDRFWADAEYATLI